MQRVKVTIPGTIFTAYRDDPDDRERRTIVDLYPSADSRDAFMSVNPANPAVKIEEFPELPTGRHAVIETVSGKMGEIYVKFNPGHWILLSAKSPNYIYTTEELEMGILGRTSFRVIFAGEA